MTRATRPSEAITIPVAPVRRLLVLAILVLVAVILFVQRDRIALAIGGTPAAYVDTTTYQSVVLVTNQVYFGRLRIDGDVYLLTDVYQLNASSDSNSGTVQLVKRGSELSGPAEPLVIPGRSVLFFENMKQDSQVMQAIRQIKSGNVSTPPPAQPSAPRTVTPSPSASR